MLEVEVTRIEIKSNHRGELCAEAQLESIKGAGDYVEDAGFIFHIELTRQHKSGGWGWAPTKPDYITRSK